MSEDYPLPDMKKHYFMSWKDTQRFYLSSSGYSKFYSKIHLSSACYQILLDDAAQEICVINTTLGLFKVLRLPQGLRNASGLFQRTIENTLKVLAGTICFQDDVLVHGRTKSQCEGFTINEIKSGNVMAKITFLDFAISGSGIEPDDRLVNKVRKIHPPQSVKKSKNFVNWSTSTACSSQTSRRKLRQYLI